MIEKKILTSIVLAMTLAGCSTEEAIQEVVDDTKEFISQSEDSTVTDGGSSSTTSDIDALLHVHNMARAEVGISNEVVWSETIAKDAQSYANEMAEKGIWAHDTLRNKNNGYGNGNYGENLYTSSRSATFDDAAQDWADEKQYYTYGKVVAYGEVDNTCVDGLDANGNEIMCGHYTQIIWEKTTLVGCAKSQYLVDVEGTNIEKGWDIIVCKYQTPGNIVGETPY